MLTLVDLLFGGDGRVTNSNDIDLTREDIQKLAARYIIPEWASRAGIYRVDSFDGARIVGRQARAGDDYSGLIIPNILPGNTGPREFRLRRDHPDLEQRSDGSHKEKGKYLSPPGRANLFYYPPNTPSEWLSNRSIPVTFVEGEFKAIALHRHYSERGERMLIIGLSGVWCWRGTIGKGADARGARRSIKGPINDFAFVEWKERKVTILFDTNVTTQENVAEARRELARELRRRLAHVGFINLPDDNPNVNGIDDLLAINGSDFIADLLSDKNVITCDPPRIQVSNRPLRDTSDDCLRVLEEANENPSIFVRSGALVRVHHDERGRPVITGMSEAHLRGLLTRAADFVRVTEEKTTHVPPPLDVVRDILALAPDKWPFPPLEAVTESPVLRPDGSVLSSPGYDPATRLLYLPVAGSRLPSVSNTPTTDEITKAIDILDEAFGDFPYAEDASAAHTLALLLTSVCRPYINGPTPLFLIDKPQAGTGGSLLAEGAAIVASGRDASMMDAPLSDEEWTKAITATLLSGATMAVIDDVAYPLNAPSLARVITCNEWNGRILGRSEMVSLPQRATFLATGNNLKLGRDLPRRCVWIRLDAKVARPWKRKGFRHSDLRAWIKENRTELLSALLTLTQSWFAAGRPVDGIPTIGSFEVWSQTVGGILKHAGFSGFLENLEEMYASADEEGPVWENFLTVWAEAFPDRAVTVAEVFNEMGRTTSLREALPDDLGEAYDGSSNSFKKKLGKALSKRDGVRYGENNIHLEKGNLDPHSKVVRWRVKQGVEADSGTSLRGLRGLRGLFDPRYEKKEKPNDIERGATQTRETTQTPQDDFSDLSEIDPSAASNLSSSGYTQGYEETF